MKQLLLTEEQRRAVEEDTPRVLLLAPAGSGKTEVLIRRIERLLAQSTGESFRLLAVTYTVKAAEEIKARVSRTIGEDAWRVDCDTLHGFALDWLRRYGSSVGINADTIVYAEDADRISLIAEYIRSLGLEDRINADVAQAVRPILAAIDECRTLCIEPPERSYFTIPLSELCDAYWSALLAAGGIDFPGILTKFQELLESDPWVADNFASLYGHILVDEGQDLTPAQSSILRLLSVGVSAFVVADDRQSINIFAGGAFANAQALVGEDAVTLLLSDNFRCCREVLNAAERVAANLQSRPDITLSTPGAPPGAIYVVQEESSEVEAAAVADWTESLLTVGMPEAILAAGEDPSVAPEEIAIVARARWLLDPVVQELERRGCRLSLNVDASDMLRSSEGRIVLEALALIARPDDRPAARRLTEAMDALGSEPFDDDVLRTLRRSGQPSLAAIADHIEPVFAGSAMLDAVLGRLVDVFGSSEWAEDAGVIQGHWLDYRSRTSAEQRSLGGYLRYVSRAHLARPTDPGVRVLTIHRVKGLEFRAVALVGVFDGALPDYRARTAAEIDAERRSLYVAMTRAKRMLRLSWPATRTDRYGRSRAQDPSRFLREANLVSVT